MFYKTQYWFNAVVGSLVVPSRHYSFKKKKKTTRKPSHLAKNTIYCTALFVALDIVAFTPIIQVRCELRQIILQNQQNAPLESVQFMGYSISCLEFTSKYWKPDRRNYLYLWKLCFSGYLSSCDLFFCSFLMVWGSCSSWLCLLWYGSSEIQFPFFSSVRQLCCK